MEIEQWGESPFDEPVSILAASDPERVAALARARWFPELPGEGRMVVQVLPGEITVTYPDIKVHAPVGLDGFALKLLTVIYLGKTDGTMPSGSWIAYRELPNGRFYEPVVRRSVEDPLARVFGDMDLERFRGGSLILGGQPEEFGDAAFSFALFPRVRLCFIMWLADREFPARAQVLFDSASSHHLNAFDLRMGAQEISSRLIRMGSDA